MRVGLFFLWITLMVAPLIAEKNPHLATARDAVPSAQQHADASLYGNKVAAHRGAMDGKLP
jgi:hypothetical protein